ncbi:MAG: hypothetical protein JXQ71_02455 [Verrucomicrobia bacterium]|nr:hypothetical protein [Verrucomicrobiota bacterium]
MEHCTRPRPVDDARIAERRQTLLEVQAAEHAVLTRYDWIDRPRGIVRLPIARAMELARIEFRDAAATRSNLLKRLEQVMAPLPPVRKPAALQEAWPAP